MTEQKKKVKACKDTEYLFISAYLRAKEPQLLNAEKAGRMLGSSVQEAARILESCGYADVLAIGLDKALNDRRAAVFSEVEALAPKDGVVALFRMRYDYHNAKTIVKAEAVGADPAPLLSGAGRADAQALKTAYETGESGSVPQAVLTAMQAARDALSRSADPQLADLILDRAYFAEYHETAAQVGSAFLMGYAQLQADSANLRAAVRARRMHKDAAFLKSVLVPGGSVPAEEICQALAQDEPFAPLFANTALFAAAHAGEDVAHYAEYRPGYQYNAERGIQHIGYDMRTYYQRHAEHYAGESAERIIFQHTFHFVSVLFYEITNIRLSRSVLPKCVAE